MTNWKQISVKEDTYRLFQKFRGLLIVEQERRVSEDEALKELLKRAVPELMSVTS